MQNLYLGNDHTTTVPNVTAGGAAAATGTMTWAVFDPAGTQVATGTLANDGQGTFTGVIESSDFATQTANTVGSIRWVFTQGGYDAAWYDDVTFLKRTPGV